MLLNARVKALRCHGNDDEEKKIEKCRMIEVTRNLKASSDKHPAQGRVSSEIRSFHSKLCPVQSENL